jgi:UDP-2,3-diacylglucosamine pyrophosphatase LpxH
MALTRYVVSDLHLGDGSSLDDFDQDQSFQRFVARLGEKKKTELIINGDFLDFANLKLKDESTKPFSRLGNTEEESLEKLDLILGGHPLVFDSLRDFIDSGHRLVVIPGNHDVDLFWPRVWEQVAERLGNPDGEHLCFEFSGIHRAGGLYIEHGNQYFSDSLFANFTHPFLRDPKSGQLRLERSWSNAFLPYFVASLRTKNPFVDNVKPVSTMVFMGIQQEGWWFRIRHAYKLIRFISRAGFPPFKDVRSPAAQAKIKEDTPSHFRKRLLMAVASRGGRRVLEGEQGLEMLDAGLEIDSLEVEESMLEQVLEEEPEGIEVYEEAFDKAFPARPEESGELVLDPLSTREDILSMQARELLLSDKGIDTVIFGHDHRLYSNQYTPLVGGKKNKYYINTGTWIPILFLTKAQKNLTWRDLADERLYHQYLTYAEVRNSHGRAAGKLNKL